MLKRNGRIKTGTQISGSLGSSGSVDTWSSLKFISVKHRAWCFCFLEMQSFNNRRLAFWRLTQGYSWSSHHPFSCYTYWHLYSQFCPYSGSVQRFTVASRSLPKG